MSITFTNSRQFTTGGPDTESWNAQTQASLSFFYRYELTGSLDASVINGNFILCRGLGSFYIGTYARAEAKNVLMQHYA